MQICVLSRLRARKVLIIIIISFFSVYKVNAADYTAEQWRAIEITLTSSVSYTDPFNAVDVTATFTGPGGVTIIRPAFWDGGTTWKVRFAPTITGNWTMTTSCTISSNSGLHNISKTVQCNAYSGNLDIYKHGFLKCHESGRYFTYADGTPFFYLGDTHWLFTHERFSTSNVSGIASQFKYTLDKRVTQGFTVYQTEAIQHPHGGTHTGLDEEPHCDFRDGLTSADLPGFQNMDRKFKYVADNGLVNANSSICWVADPADFSIYTDSYMYKLSRYWVARYGAYPVLWTIAQEIDKGFYGTFNSTTISKWYSVGQAIWDNDAYKHPLSAHMENTEQTVASTSSWGSKPYHGWWAVQVQLDISNFTPKAKDFWNYTPTKPSILYEAYYDEFATDTKGARSQGYVAFQSGMYGYGANGVWNDLYAVGDYGTAFLMPDKYTNWHDGANLISGSQMTHLKNFYTNLQWWKLKPRFDDANWASFSNPAKSLLATDGQKTFVAYFFGSGNSTGTLKNLQNGFIYNAKWYDPRTGQYINIADFTTSNAQWTIPARPAADDYVLLVKSIASTRVLNTNLALGKSYSSSSNYNSDQVALNAFDANYSTNWQSQDGTFANQWLTVNFGGNTTFNAVVLSEYGDRTSGFRIEYSTNGTTWSTAYTGTKIGSNRVISFSPVTANYARLYFTSGTSYQPIIYEFQVYNTAETPSQTSNLALSRTYSSSSNYNSSQVASKAFDANYSTNWQSQDGTFANQWLSVDFGSNISFDSVILSEYGNRTTGFRIEYSANGSNWSTAYTGTTIGSKKTLTFNTITARYARIYFTSGTGYQPIIYEFEAYNRNSNLALNNTYTSSTNWDSNQTADKAFDSNISTNWQAQDGAFANQWLAVNFGRTVTFNKVFLSEYGNRTTSFKIEYSDDGSIWQTAYNGTTIGYSKTIAFDPVTAIYARIYFIAGTGNAPIIYEFGIYDSTANPSSRVAREHSIDVEAYQLKQELFTLYPNPADKEVKVIYTADKNCDLLISIYNSVGKQVITRKKNAVKGQNIEHIDVSGLLPGLYFVKIEGYKNMIQKLILRD